jgi:purine-binding chemotaxis protein CheW
MPSFLTVTFAGDTYAMPLARVREIIEYAAPSRVPAMPDCVRGVISLRGSVVPVIDLARKLGVGEIVATKRTCITMIDVFAEGEPLALGVLSDSVDDIVDLADTDIAPAPPFGARVRLEYLRGIARTGGGILLVLDVDRVLSLEELGAVESTRGGAQ